MSEKMEKKDALYNECIVSAPSSTANLGPGYDVFGLGLDALEDRILLKVNKRSTHDSNDTDNSNNIQIRIMGEGGKDIPLYPNQNSSGKVARKIIHDFNLFEYEFIIEITKNIPPGYGMGSSAASAVATAVAFNKVFNLTNNNTQLLYYAAEGEIASAGIKHYDNVAGSFFGDFVIVKDSPELEFIKIESPKDLILVVCVPLIDVPKMKTGVARSVLPREVPLKKMVQNLANACTIVAGFYKGDTQMICRGINDCIIEPARQKLIPGYYHVKENSINAGALAFTISGAGPSTIAFSDSKKAGTKISSIMKETYEKLNINCKTFVCTPSKGSKIILTR
ncbi:MAG: homoserine kinase [Thermoproteota archaeon]|nr:homoserine kinase [Thermoproteota archaeon]